jgi:predicted ArsR family transcriptional regulator
MTDDLARLAPLADPVRRSLYDFVVGQPDAVDRDVAASGVGIARALAAFHLDRLVAAGLLVAEFRRRSGRSGPGAGRPAKFYRRDDAVELEVSLPPRHYDAVADVLAVAVESSEDARSAALDAARERGIALAEGSASDAPRDLSGLTDLLADAGYEPALDSEGVVRLGNCPFDRLAASHRNLTCSLNLATLNAVSERFAAAAVEAVPRPRDGFCCVAFVPRT